MSKTNSAIGELYAEFRIKSRAFANNLPLAIQSFETSLPSTLIKDLFYEVQAENWNGIREMCYERMMKTEISFSKMTEFQNQFNTILNYSAALNAEIKKAKPASKIKDWKKMKADAISKLMEIGVEKTKIEDAIKQIESYKPAKIDDKTFKNYQRIITSVDEMASVQLVNYMHNYFARLVSLFNLRYSEPSEADRKAIGTFISTNSKELLFKTEAIQEALAINDYKTGRVNALNLISWIENELLEKAIAYAANLASLRDSQEDDFEKDGQLSVAIGQLLRKLLYSISLAKWISWTCNWHSSLASPNMWGKFSSKLTIADQPSIELTKIASVNSDPANFDGKFVTVEGEISEVTIVHLRQKAISSASIIDSSGNSIKIVMPYIKFDSTGMSKGSYAQVSGVFQSVNKELNGGPGLSIDMTSLAQESKTDWLAWTKLQMRQIYNEMPHYINAQFSWQAGSDGAINPIKYNTLFQHYKDASK
jgi:hypothetical protein